VNRFIAFLSAAALAGAAIASAGCAPSRFGSLGPAPTGVPAAQSPAGQSPTASPSSPPGPSPGSTASATPPSRSPSAVPTPPGTITIQLWYARSGRIVPTVHTRPATLATSRLALTELTTGPSTLEAAAGLTSGLPAGTTFTIVGIDAGVERVVFPPSFYAGGQSAVRLRQAQVVYTLTQFSSVSRVSFLSDGHPTSAPVGRADYADLLPPIVVTSPVIGQRVSSGLTVTGTADVFEATVSVRILDAAGHEIATTFTTATCGSGCRGDYRVTVTYELARNQPGTIEVYEVSAKDGSRINMIAIPVTLTAS
jgi:hypothetical protein